MKPLALWQPGVLCGKTLHNRERILLLSGWMGPLLTQGECSKISPMRLSHL